MVFLTASGANALRMERFNFDRLTDTDSVIVQKSGSSLVIDVDGLRYAFAGSGVRYNSFDEPTSGAITGLTISGSGGTLFQASGFSIPATTFYLATYAPGSPFPLIFAGDDRIEGSGLADAVYAYGGHDVVNGGGGADVILAGDGNDHVYGQSPNGGADGADLINGEGGSDYLQGNAGNDTVNGGEGSDRINGGADNDQLLGQGGHDSINGNLGNDAIDGGGDNDQLRGGQGNDTLGGGAGNDVLMGDRGIDQLRGGTGDDVFVFGPDTSPIGATAETCDTIQDFGTGNDRFSLGFRPAALLVEASDAATIRVFADARAIAEAAFARHAGDGEVALVYRSPYEVYLFWNSAGGATIDSAVYLFGYQTHDFGLADFI